MLKKTQLLNLAIFLFGFAQTVLADLPGVSFRP